MNSEEIEVSLKAEFESYLKDVSDGFKQKLSQLQTNIDAEIARHQEEFAKVFSESADLFDGQGSMKASFADIVSEHLKLARDEGAQISANAFAEAEKYEKENAEPVAPLVPVLMGNSTNIRDAVRDVNDKNSQVDILKSLIDHAAEFAPRGAFFVLKNERFGGWKTFGAGDDGDDAVKHVSFSIDDPSVVNEAVNDNTTKESFYGEYAEDTEFLKQVGFGEPEKMYAVPLVVRGRTVAVLYADSGMDGAAVNVDALDTLVQFAGLRVELLASMKAQPEQAAEATETVQAAEVEAEAEETTTVVEAPAYDETPSYDAAPEYDSAPSYADTYAQEPVVQYDEPAPIAQPVESFYGEPVVEEAVEFVREAAPIAEVETEAEWSSSTGTFEMSQPETVASVEEVEEVEEVPAAEFEYNSDYSTVQEAEPAPAAQEFEVAPSYEATPAPSFDGYSPVKEAPSFESFKAEPEVVSAAPSVLTEESAFTTQVTSQPVSTPSRSRLSERNVDLPIEVSDEDRRLHNDARRFARLLVSEIKLYNEAKVKEGRDNGDIYNRLQEAVDRSREMYDKRVQPAVAGRFDYFHFELVNSLAEGDEAKLGSTYPGSAV